MANPTNTNTKHKQICRAVLPICKQPVLAPMDDADLIRVYNTAPP